MGLLLVFVKGSKNQMEVSSNFQCLDGHWQLSYFCGWKVQQVNAHDVSKYIPKCSSHICTSELVLDGKLFRLYIFVVFCVVMGFIRRITSPFGWIVSINIITWMLNYVYGCFFKKLPTYYTLVGIDLTTHNSSLLGGRRRRNHDTTRPRRQGKLGTKVDATLCHQVSTIKALFPVMCIVF
jgi:hypothetical protein